MRSALEWAQVRALVADGVSEREIARPLGINRRTVKRLAEADELPRYERVPAGSMLDPLEPVIRGLIEECPEIKAPRVTETLRDDYGYTGSVDRVRKRLAVLRPSGGERAAQRTGYRPGHVMHRGRPVARYPRSYAQGRWQPEPRMRPEPPQTAPAGPIAVPEVIPPALTDYAEVCT